MNEDYKIKWYRQNIFAIGLSWQNINGVIVINLIIPFGILSIPTRPIPKGLFKR